MEDRRMGEKPDRLNRIRKKNRTKKQGSQEPLPCFCFLSEI